MSAQRAFAFRTWGGPRRGAGRKPAGSRAGEKHLARPAVRASTPLHLTMRVAQVPNLRAQRCIAAIRRALRGGKARPGFRLVHYAVQPDHLHFIVEADNARLLSNAARGLAIRIARAVNAAIGRKGRVFPDRYHAVALGSPRQVHHALRYVLLQARRHAAKSGTELRETLDGCSSAPLFDGFARGRPRAGPWSDTVVPAESWLLRTGWRRHGLIDPRAIPGRRERGDG